jgi:aminoglycoside/choline kinase family phosphotransferase
VATVTGGLSDRQCHLLTQWLGRWEVVADLSWPLQDTVVVQVRSYPDTQPGNQADDADHIVKASLTSHHIGREIRAHQDFLSHLNLPAPRLEHADLDAGILVTTHVPGDIVQGATAERDPETYRQAGQILRRLQVPGEWSDRYVARLVASSRSRAQEAAGLVPAAQLVAVEDRLRGVHERPVRLHLTHGDYHPRNWLVHEGSVAVIDFGRAAQRSWVSDLVRLRTQQFVGHPELEEAFMAGLGRALTTDDADLLALETIHEALGTVTWSHRIGDADFEDHGRAVIARCLMAPQRTD